MGRNDFDSEDRDDDKGSARRQGYSNSNPQRRQGPSILSLAVLACSVVAAVVGCIVVAMQKRSKSDSAGGTPEPPPQDYAQYVESLKVSVPFDSDAFARSGYKATDYKKESNSNMFVEVTIKIDPPVRLTDKITGKTERYSQARLTRNTPSPSVPAGTRMSASELGTMTRQSALNADLATDDSWQRVEMLK